MNTLALVGHLTRVPSTKWEGAGMQVATMTLAITEQGKDGRTYTLYVPCVAYGHAAESCGVLEAETLVSLVGKLTWRKQPHKCGEAYSSLVVLVQTVQVLQSEVAA